MEYKLAAMPIPIAALDYETVSACKQPHSPEGWGVRTVDDRGVPEGLSVQIRGDLLDTDFLQS